MDKHTRGWKVRGNPLILSESSPLLSAQAGPHFDHHSADGNKHHALTTAAILDTPNLIGVALKLGRGRQSASHQSGVGTLSSRRSFVLFAL